jgi:hypothetical protein
LSHLWKSCGCNPHSAGKVIISANDERSDRTFQVYDLISSESKSGKWWGTNNNAIDHHVKFEFRDCQICPSGYSLKEQSSAWNGGFLRSWRFEGSNDDLKWDTLDTQTDCDAMKGYDREASFRISTSNPYQFLRILFVGQNWSNQRQVSFQRIEIFGRILS